MRLRIAKSWIGTFVYAFFCYIIAVKISRTERCTVAGFDIDELPLRACSHAFPSYVISVISIRACLNTNTHSTRTICEVVVRAVHQTSACKRICQIIGRADGNTKICGIIRIIRDRGSWAWSAHFTFTISRTSIVIIGTSGSAVGTGPIHMEGTNWTGAHTPRTIIIGVGGRWAI